MENIKSSIFDFLQFSTPTNEQRNALTELENFVSVNNSDDFLIMIGAAGTGKTSLTTALVGYLNHLKYPYKIAAPTGRAARIIGKAARSNSSTVHSLIYKSCSDENTGTVRFELMESSNVDPVIFIVDEASMIKSQKPAKDGLFEADESLLDGLITYVKQGNAGNKIIFLGDRYQLPPIFEEESLALNPDYLASVYNLSGKVITLSEVKRQSDGSYVLTNANKVRSAIDKGGGTVRMEGEIHRNIFSAAPHYARTIEREGLEKAISIGVSHKANQLFNDLVRKERFGIAKKILEPGDLMIVLQNYLRSGLDINNGDHVRIEAIDWSEEHAVAGLHFVAVKVKLLFNEANVEVEDLALIESIISPGGQLPREAELALRAERMRKNPLYRESKMPADDRYVGALRLAYGNAITCNKAQGGEWEKVYVNTFGIPSLKWQYTAITRAKQENHLF